MGNKYFDSKGICSSTKVYIMRKTCKTELASQLFPLLKKSTGQTESALETGLMEMRDGLGDCELQISLCLELFFQEDPGLLILAD